MKNIEEYKSVLKSDFKNGIMDYSNFEIGQNVLDLYFDKWANAKKDLFKMLGNQLSVSHDIMHPMDKEEVRFIMSDFLNEIREKGLAKTEGEKNFAMKLKNLSTEDIMSNSAPTELRTAELTVLAKMSEELIIKDDFDLEKHKKIVSDFDKLHKRLNSKVKLTKLISKVLGEQAGQIYSKYISRVKDGKSTVHLSINPLDYIHMSHSKSGWSSCLSLEGGCYRGGVFSYLLDKHTLIAWIGDEHNNKKWRMCVYIDPETKRIVFSRQYPSLKNDVFTDTFLKIVQDIVHKGDDLKYEVFKDQRKCKNQFRIHNSCVLYSDVHSYGGGWYRLSMPITEDEPEVLTMGSEIYCLECGNAHTNGDGILHCDDCYNDEDYGYDEDYDEDEW